LPLENLGLRLVLGFSESLQLFLVATPLILFAGAAQLTLASFAKSFKEAQTYLSMSLLLPMLPGLFLSMKPVEPELWMAAVPALGQQVMTSIVLRGEPIPMSYWAVSIGVSVLLTVMSLWYCVYLFRSEHFFKKS
jgi:sodium transport system permease protein